MGWVDAGSYPTAESTWLSKSLADSIANDGGTDVDLFLTNQWPSQTHYQSCSKPELLLRSCKKCRQKSTTVP